jgi:hypothetical protein
MSAERETPIARATGAIPRRGFPARTARANPLFLLRHLKRFVKDLVLHRFLAGAAAGVRDSAVAAPGSQTPLRFRDRTEPAHDERTIAELLVSPRLA